MEEPVTVDEVKPHLRVAISFTDDDAYIETLISSARWQTEVFTRRALLTQTWEMFLDHFPVHGMRHGIYNRNIEDHCIRVIKPPLQSVSFVKYLDPGGVLQIMDPSTYVVDTSSEPGRITTAIGVPWPPTGRLPNSVQVQFVAGFAASADDALALDPSFNVFKLAIMHLVGHWYQNREPVVANQAVVLPMHVQSLLLSKSAKQF